MKNVSGFQSNEMKLFKNVASSVNLKLGSFENMDSHNLLNFNAD